MKGHTIEHLLGEVLDVDVEVKKMQLRALLSLRCNADQIIDDLSNEMAACEQFVTY
nr:hypothetical protein [Sinorhizobium meliloti]